MRLSHVLGHLPAPQAGKGKIESCEMKMENAQEGGRKNRPKGPGWWCMPVILGLRGVATAKPVWARLKVYYCCCCCDRASFSCCWPWRAEHLLPEPGVIGWGSKQQRLTQVSLEGWEDPTSLQHLQPGTLQLDGASSTERVDALAFSESLLWVREAPLEVCLPSLPLFLSAVRHKTL